MARIFISYSHLDVEYAKGLADALTQLGHSAFYAEGVIQPGQPFQQILSQALREADTIVFLVSRNAEQSRYVQSEIGAALGYFEERGRPLLIPVSLDDTEAPPQIRHIRAIFTRQRQVDEIAREIAGAVERASGQAQALLEKRQEARARIESTAEVFIKSSLADLRLRESRYRRIAQTWYAVACVTLVGGLAFALWRALRFGGAPPSGLALIAIAILGAAVFGLLLSVARLAFVLGRAYMVEALRNSDRIHAITFGEFYLKAFPDRAEWEQVKDAFQHWNIDKGASFLAQRPAEFDPEVFKLVVSIAETLANAKKR